MAKRQKQPEHDNSGDWLNTYADMVTLLLTFFVMLYASSSLDEQKWQLIYQAFQSHGKYINQYVDSPNPIDEDGEGTISENESADGGEGELPQSFDMLYTFLTNYVSEHELTDVVSVEQGKAHITIRFDDSVFFLPDSAELRQEGKDVINGIAPGLKAVADAIQTCTVSGHTAGGIISPVNDWALSCGRAVSVINYMEFRKVLDTSKFIAQGCGPNRPIADNTTEEGRAKNRRVEMMFVKSDLDMMNSEVLQDILASDYGLSPEQFDPDAAPKPDDTPEKLPDGATQTVIDNINTLFPDEDSAMTSGYAGPVIGNFDSFLYDVTEEDADADADSASGEETE